MQRTKLWWQNLTSDERRELTRLERDGWLGWQKGDYERWMELVHNANIWTSIRLGRAYCPVCGDRGCGHVDPAVYVRGGLRKAMLARCIVENA